MAEDEMVGWHHQLNEHEFEQTLGLLRRRTGEPGQGYQKVGRDLVTEQQLVDNVTFTSDVQQNDSVIYIYIFFFGFFSIVGYHKILNTVPCAIQ